MHVYDKAAHAHMHVIIKHECGPFLHHSMLLMRSVESNNKKQSMLRVVLYVCCKTSTFNQKALCVNVRMHACMYIWMHVCKDMCMSASTHVE